MVKYKVVEEIVKIMRNLEQVRNMGIIAHVDHGKTTTSDNLLMAAGIISPKVAGQALALDFLDIEQRRQMTVKAANVSLYHEYEGKPYVINLIDTPGHVDFSGKVTRSLRVLDGAIVVVDAVEGVMTQTETVLRQALEERVRPLLFINKVDRLIKELRLTPAQVQERLIGIIKEINGLIDTYAEPEFKNAWKLNPAVGHVAFGAAKDKWGFTVPHAQKKGLKFSDVVEAYKRGPEGVEELAKTVPLHESLLDMVVKYVPNPLQAQKYRIPRIWRGDLDTPLGKAMLECDPNGPTILFINNINLDPHAGLVATGRVFSGTVKNGTELYLLRANTVNKVLQVGIYMGPYREVVDEIPAGNIVAVLGLEYARAGETGVSPEYKDLMVPFERFKYISEPVVTIAVEPKNSRDLPKLVEILRRMSIEDPNLHVKINEETGEYLISGMGHLHLEIVLTLIKENYGLEVIASKPIIVYRESIRGKSRVFEGKSPNKHNKFYISVEPLDDETIKLIQEGIIYENQDSRERAKLLRTRAGWSVDEARGIWAIDDRIDVFIDATKGVQHLREVKETIIGGFRLAMEEGPLAHEPVRGVKVILHDAIVHEDPAHRGPAQIYPAVRNAIFAGMLTAKPTILEPLQKLDIRTPMEFMGNITRVLSQRRGRILSVEQQGPMARIIAEIPVAESQDLATVLRSATAGKAFWGTEFSRWAPVPDSMLPEVIRQIRLRKGLKPEPPRAEDFISL